MALVYWRAICGVVVLPLPALSLQKSGPFKSSTFVAGLDDPTGNGNPTQGTPRAHTSTAQCQPSSPPSLVRESLCLVFPTHGRLANWPPPALGSVSCAVAVSTSHLPGIMSHLGSVCLCRCYLLPLSLEKDSAAKCGKVASRKPCEYHYHQCSDSRASDKKSLPWTQNLPPLVFCLVLDKGPAASA